MVEADRLVKPRADHVTYKITEVGTVQAHRGQVNKIINIIRLEPDFV